MACTFTVISLPKIPCRRRVLGAIWAAEVQNVSAGMGGLMMRWKSSEMDGNEVKVVGGWWQKCLLWLYIISTFSVE